MASPLNNRIIRNSSPPELARYLQTQLKSKHWKTISDHLISSVESGSISPDIFQVWLAVCKDEDAITAALRQDVSVLARHIAIRRFGKQLRTDAAFSAIWKSIEGINGLLDLMAVISVDHVRMLCETISFSCKATGAANQRRNAVSELYNALCGNGETPNPDTRPLESLYVLLLPACTAETALAYTKSPKLRRRVVDAHMTSYEKKALQEIFPTEGEAKKICDYDVLLDLNRQFAFTVLKRIATDKPALEFNKDLIGSHLFIPLLRRLYNARNHDTADLVLSMILQCVDTEPQIAQSIGFERKGVLFYAIQHWKRSHDREKAEKHLIGLVSSTSDRAYEDVLSVGILVRTVEPLLRYTLLRLFLLHSSCYCIDISAEEECNDLRLAEIGQSLPIDLLLDLHAPEALRLFKRLAKACPDGKFLSPTTYSNAANRIVTTLAVDDCYVDSEIIAAYLESRIATTFDEKSPWFVRAKKVVFERKSKAANAREWEERSKWAVSAIKLSIASKSLELYAETLLWARRFNRDAQTVKALYEASNVLSDEGLNLLSGLPSPKAKQIPMQLEEMKMTVIKSNEIIFTLLKTVAMGIQEPWFNLFIWGDVKDVPAKALRRRLERIQDIKAEHGISDDDIQRSVWDPTIELLTDLELFGLEPENSRLGMNEFLGPLWEWEAVTPNESTCTFFDKLAEKRNEIWTKHRATVHPATTTLAKLWPRGLPVQVLCPKIELTTYGLPAMPYLQSRCEDVVFSPSSVLTPIPKDEETRDAIGYFVNSYIYALRIYLLGAKSSDERERLLQAAWTHATTTLTENRMDPDEAIDFWAQSVFCKTELEPGLKTDLERLIGAPKHAAILTQLPEAGDEGTPVEWNPQSTSKAPQASSRELSQTCLDCMLALDLFSQMPRYADAIFSETISRTVEYSSPPIWWLRRYPTPLSGPTKDALIAASIVNINTKHGWDSSLFLKHFPAEDDIRFPALYLDAEFLEAQPRKDSAPELEVLSELLSRVPVLLLSRLARSLMERLVKSEKEDPNVREAFMETIKRLARSDRPSIACQFVQRVVLDRQDDSSWHRHLFNVGFLRRLSIKDAKTFFDGLSTEIQGRQRKIAAEQAKRTASKKLPQQIEQLAQESPGSDPSSPKKITVEVQLGTTMIKVTTIKMVAQMLRKAEFVDRPFACNILLGLLKGSSHPDIQIAIVEGLIDLLAETKEPKLQAVIYEILEMHIIPIASSVNERRPPKEEEWLAAEAGDSPLPEIYDSELNLPLPPMLQRLSMATMRFKEGTPERHQWVTRIIVPITEKSAAENARWISIFVKRHNFDIPKDYLPTLPVKRNLLLICWTSVPQCFTKHNFDTLKRYSMVNLRPHSSLLAANEAVKKDGDLFKSNAGKYWLYLWDNPGADAFQCGINEIAHTFYKLDSENELEVTISEVQAFINYLMADFIGKAEIENFERLISSFSNTSVHSQDKWISNCLPLLQGIIEDINELRTEAWQRDPHRTPARLPETLSIRQKIVRAKHQQFRGSMDYVPSQEAIDNLVVDVSALIDELIADSVPYHEQWPELIRTIKGMAYLSNYVQIGSALAEKAEAHTPKLADYLKIEMADILFEQRWGKQTEELLNKVRITLETWAGSPIESIRLRGSKTLKRFDNMEKNKVKQDLWGAGDDGGWDNL